MSLSPLNKEFKTLAQLNPWVSHPALRGTDADADVSLEGRYEVSTHQKSGPKMATEETVAGDEKVEWG